MHNIIYSARQQVLEKLGLRLFRARSRDESMFFVLISAEQVWTSKATTPIDHHAPAVYSVQL